MIPRFIKAHETLSGDTIVWTTSNATSRGLQPEFDYRSALFYIVVDEEIEECEEENENSVEDCSFLQTGHSMRMLIDKNSPSFFMCVLPLGARPRAL